MAPQRVPNAVRRQQPHSLAIDEITLLAFIMVKKGGVDASVWYKL